MRVVEAAVVLSLLLGIEGALGSAPAQAPVPPSPEQSLPAYQERLDRLSELLGVLAFMRTLCGADASPDWRGKMAALVEAEGSTQARRARLAGSFNHGFEGYRQVYRSCTPAAQTVVARSLAEGERLATSLSRRFTAD